MRRLFVVVALLGVMLFMLSFQTRTDAPDSVITLAAIGFVVLATFAIADMGTRLSLPRVTGFIVTGVVLGPSAANILSARVVEEMRMFNTLALGLIATSAGLELDLKALLPLFKTLGSTTATKVLLGVPVVGLVLLGMSHVVDLGVETAQQRFALAIVMGVLSIGTSPSIALAILSETKAKGRLSDLVLGAAVFKDLVVVVCLAVALAVAATLLDPGSTGDANVLLHVIRELVGSLIAGASLGGILIAYIRLIRAEMLLFVAAMILVVAELCRVFHLELLLVFIAAGFVVRNFSEYEHDLLKPLEMVALPIFVVFFTIAGAGINIATTWAILPAALAICVTRAIVYWISAWVGNRIGNEPAAIRRHAWSAYLPQAGVTLGLVGLAAHKLPSLHDQITTTGMAVVAINLLIGPVTLRLALAKAGEVQTNNTPAKVNTVALSSPLVASRLPNLTTAGEPLAAELRGHLDALEQFTSQSLIELFASARASEVEFSLEEEPTLETRLALVRIYRAAAERWYERWVNNLTALPTNVTVPYAKSELKPLATDSVILRTRLLRARLAMTFRKAARERHIPARLAARMSVEPTVAKIAAQFYEACLSNHVSKIRPGGDENSTPELWQAELTGAFANLSRLMALADTPRVSRKALRFSEIEGVIRAELAPLDEKRDEFYAARVSALWGLEVAKERVTTLRTRLTEAVNVQIAAPASQVVARLDAAFGHFASALSPLTQTNEESMPTLRAALPTMAEELLQLRHGLADDLARAFRASVVMRELGSSIKTAVEELPTELRCYQLPADVEGHQPGIIRRINLREIADTYLVKRLLPTLDQSVKALSNAFAHAPRSIREILHTITDEDQSPTPEVSAHSYSQRIQRTLAELAALHEALVAQVDYSLHHDRQALTSALHGLEREVTTAQPLAETTSHRIRRLLGRLVQYLYPFWTKPARRARKRRPDARATSLSLREWQHPSLPASVVGWFSQQPVRDERIYSDQSNLIHRILEEEARWRSGEKVALLVRGETGSGKTSLLNMCELELRATQILRLDGEGAEQAGQLTSVLASLLGVAETEASLIHALTTTKPALLIDNLPLWLMRGNDPLGQLTTLLSLITRTPGTFWLVASEPSFEDRFETLTSVEAAFTSVFDIPAVSRLDLRHMILSRAGRAQELVEFRTTVMGRILAQLGLRGDEFIYFMLLGRYCRGNPGRALALVLASATRVNERLELDARRLSTRATGFVPQLSAPQLCVAMAVVEQGPMTLDMIADRIGQPRENVEVDVAYLLTAEVLHREPEGTHELSDRARWATLGALEQAGAVVMLGQGGPTQSNVQRRVRYAVGLAVLLLVATSLIGRWVRETSWYQWFAVASLGVLVFWSGLQNLIAGAVVRASGPLRRGDHLCVKTMSGTIARVGLTHVHILDDRGGTTLLPYRSLVATRMQWRSGTRFGARVRARLPNEGTSELEQFVLRTAHFFPFKAPSSPVVVNTTPTHVTIELYTWSQEDKGTLTRYLRSRTRDFRRKRTTDS